MAIIYSHGVIFLKKFCLTLCLILLLSSCDKKTPSCYEIYCALSPREAAVEVYPYRSDLIHAEFFSRLYYGKKADHAPDEFMYCDDYYVALSSRNEIWEIHIFHVLSSYDQQAVSSMLQKRRDRLQLECASGMYDELTMERIKKAKIIIIDNFIILCITDHNDQIEKELRKII